MEGKSKIAVIYKSKYGSTKKYAGWIAIKLDADLYELSDITSGDLPDYETIIYGSSLHIGKIKGLNFITKNYEKIKNKNIIIFAVGLAKDSEGTIKNIKEINFSEEFSKTANLFYLRGQLDYKDMTLVDKLLMRGLKKSLEKKSPNELDNDDKLLLESFFDKIDYTDKNSVYPIIEYVNGKYTKNNE
ncbi:MULTISPECIES: flavodoxin domain-containing protein [unclassified Romboutsia]|uniref:flavodoxin domain-containing protein n=1 Tax=unclassified Romboutsia TaxID=2626894 RepID=UPI000820779F|nr:MULTISPECIES: flavodoxin domain-containing protein [unclassified Romboutsia]SCH61253.1 flavodoxin [uncultured Clostridium sp.]